MSGERSGCGRGSKGCSCKNANRSITKWPTAATEMSSPRAKDMAKDTTENTDTAAATATGTDTDTDTDTNAN